MDLIEFSEFMNFKNDKPINEAVAGFDRLSEGFKKTVDGISKDSARLGGEYMKITTEAKKLIKELESLNVQNKKSQDAILKTATDTDQLTQAAEKNTHAQEVNKKAIDSMVTATQKLAEAKDKLLKGQSIELGSIDAMKAKVEAATKAYYAMGEATKQSIKDEQLEKIAQLNKEYTEANTKVNDAKKAVLAAGGAYTTFATQVHSSQNEIAAYNADMEKTGDVLNEQDREYQKVIQDAIRWGETVKLNAAAQRESAESGEAVVEQTKEVEEAYKAQEGTIDALIQKREQLKASIKEEQDGLKTLNKDLADGKISQSQYEASLVAANVNIEEHKNELKDVNDDIKAFNVLQGQSALEVNVKTASLEELEAALKINRASYSKLTSEEQRNSKEGKELLKIIDKQDKASKKLSASMGDHTKNVGNYKSAVEDLGLGFGGLDVQIAKTGKALATLATSTVGIVILAIAAALGTLVVWFERTGDSAKDDLELSFAGVLQVFQTILDVVAKMGGALVAAIMEPKKIFDGFREIVGELWTGLKGVFEDPIPAMKNFGQFLVDQIMNRLKALWNMVVGIGSAFMALWDGDWDAFKKGLADAGKAAIDVLTGVENTVDKIVEAFSESALAESLKRAYQLGVEIKKLQKEIEKMEIAAIKTRADRHKAATEAMLRSESKLTVSAEDRYKAIKKYSDLNTKVLRDELAIAQKALLVEQKKIQAREIEGAINEEFTKAYNEAYAKVIDLQTQQIQMRADNMKREIKLIREIEADIVAAAKREFEVAQQVAKVKNEIRMREQKNIAADMRNELDVRNEALRQIQALEEEALNAEKDTALRNAKENALSRVQLSEETLKTIFDDETKSVADRLALERKYKEEALVSDQTYADEVNAIIDSINDKIAETKEVMTTGITTNIFTQLADDMQAIRDKVELTTSENLQDLNEEYQKGNKTIAAFERDRRKIIFDTNWGIIDEQIKYLEKKKDLLQQNGEDTLGIENEISQARLQLNQMTVDQLLEQEQQLASAKEALTQQVFTSGVEVMNNLFEAESMALENRMTTLQTNYDQQLAMLGDNEEAKAELETEFNARKAALEAKQREQQRKQAEANKAIAAFEIGVNTARGISNALASFFPPISFVMAGIVGAMGALQLAAVLSKPLPQLYTGTDYSDEGFAIVNEKGPELMRTPGGDYTMAPGRGPTLTYLEKGTKVYTADQTRDMLERPMLTEVADNLRMDADGISVINQEQHDRQMAAILRDGFTTLINATKKNKPNGLSKEDISEGFREALEWQAYLDKNYR